MIVICKYKEDLDKLPDNLIGEYDELVVNKRFYITVLRMIKTIDKNRREVLKSVGYKGKKRAVIKGWRYHDA